MVLIIISLFINSSLKVFQPLQSCDKDEKAKKKIQLPNQKSY